MTAASWDDLEAQRALDAEDMAGAIARMPEVVGEAFAAGQAVGRPLASPRAVVVVAMGGSAIGADLLRGLAGPMASWPILVHRGPGLPPWVGPEDLVVLASHSGSTAETLDAFQQARQRGLPLLVVSSGGALAQAAQAEGLPWLRLPPGGAPRAALGWGLFGLAGALLGEAEGWAPRLAAVEAALRQRAASCGLASPLALNPAKALARSLVGQAVGVVAGGPDTEAIARRWACQLHENAKCLAWASALPEWSHNEVVAWGQGAHPHHRLLWLAGPTDTSLAQAQRRAAFELLGPGHGQVVEAAPPSAKDPWAAALDLIALGDWTSLHLAFAQGLDPTPIAPILALKAKLAASL